MNRTKSLFFILFACFGTVVASETDCLGQQHSRFGVRYTGPKGIGYKKGYETLEVFLAPRVLGSGWLPFVDGKWHTFGARKWAANAGLGLRYISSNYVFGVNSYYDYRTTTHKSYNQVGAGLEVLGKVWDFRLNGYFPFGKKQSSFFGERFDSFHQNFMIVAAKKEYAFRGANAEVGLHVDSIKQAPIYIAAGPYYLNGKGDSTWGGKLRTRVEFLDGLLHVEGNCSYDHHFKWIGQGQIGLNLSFGCKNKLPQKPCIDCSTMQKLETRAIQPVYRKEIMPVSNRKITGIATGEGGLPHWFWFVNNTSSSNGTFESPYPTLKEAEAASSPNEFIYLFCGDGTTSGYDEGLILKDGQSFLGASYFHPVETTNCGGCVVFVPPHCPIPPKLASPDGINIVDVANNNTVSGHDFLKSNSGNTIFGDGIDTFVGNRNRIELSSPAASAHHFINPTGSVTCKKDQFGDLSSTQVGILVEVKDTTVQSVNLSENQFASVESGGAGIHINATGGLGGIINDVNTSQNEFKGTIKGTGIKIDTDLETAAITGISTVRKNLFASVSGSGAFGIILFSGSGTALQTLVELNSFTQVSDEGTGILISSVGGGPVFNTNFTKNIFSEITGENSSGIHLEAGAVRFLPADIENNRFNLISGKGTGVLISSIGEGTFANIKKNTFPEITGEDSKGIDLSGDVKSGSPGHRLIVSDNTFGPIEDLAFGVNIAPSAGTIETVQITGNNFPGSFLDINPSKARISISPSGGTISSIDIKENNVFTNVGIYIVGNSTFNEEAIQLRQTGGTIDTLSIEGNRFEKIAGTGVSLVVEGGTLSTLTVDGCQFKEMEADTGIGLSITPSGGTISALSFEQNQFDVTRENGIGIQFVPTGGTISSLSISGGQITNISEGGTGILFAPETGVSISDPQLTEISFSKLGGNGIQINPAGTGTISGLSISDNQFIDISEHGVGISLLSTKETVSDLDISTNVFSNITNGIGVLIAPTGGTLSDLDVSTNQFNTIVGGMGVSLSFQGGVIDPLGVESNTFTTIVNGGNGISVETGSGSCDELNIRNNQFQDIRQGSGKVVDCEINAVTNMDFTGNSFSLNANTYGPEGPNENGYAGLIQATGGTTCLEITGNTSTPSFSLSPIFAFLLDGDGGTINRTGGSDSDGGNLTSLGTVGAPGTCSQ